MSNAANDYLLSLKEITQYEGKWVAVLDGKISCSNTSLIKVKQDFLKLKKSGTPLFDRIPKQEEVSTFIF